MVQRGDRQRLRAMIGVFALGLIGAACGESGPETAVVEQSQAPGTSSSPITAEVPADWQLVTAGVGTGQQTWGEDCCGSTEPYTVVKVEGEDRTITVAATGYGEYQGGLAQASSGYMGDITELDVDGRTALLSLGSEDPQPGAPPSDLVVDVDGDSAIHVMGVGATSEQLVALAANATITDDHRVAPQLEPVPQGFEVVGSVNATAVGLLVGSVSPGTENINGDEATHTLGWTVGPAGPPGGQATVLLAAVPANSVSLAALEVDVAQSAGSADVTRTADRLSFSIEETAPGQAGSLSRTVVGDTSWGDQLIAVANSRGPKDQLPTLEQLDEVVASTTEADADEWAKLIEDANGGPGLNPDAGQSEVARGEADGIEWLLQTGEPGWISSTDGRIGVDECLKLGDGTSACPTSGSASGVEDQVAFTMATGEFGPNKLAFVGMVVANDDPTASLRLTLPDGSTQRADFHPVPGADTRAAVLVGDQPGQFRCDGPGPQVPVAGDGQSIGSLERLDAKGNSLGCTTG